MQVAPYDLQPLLGAQVDAALALSWGLQSEMASLLALASYPRQGPARHTCVDSLPLCCSGSGWAGAGLDSLLYLLSMQSRPVFVCDPGSHVLPL